jgi:hypothetical protein
MKIEKIRSLSGSKLTSSNPPLFTRSSPRREVTNSCTSRINIRTTDLNCRQDSTSKSNTKTSMMVNGSTIKTVRFFRLWKPLMPQRMKNSK